MHIAWCCLEKVTICFSGSSVKYQGHTALKIVEFDPDWAFSDCNSSLNSPMATKWCTTPEEALERYPIVFQGHTSNFNVTRLKKIVDFDPNWPFPDCNSSLNSPMATEWCTKLEVESKRCPIVFQSHTSNYKVTRLKKSSNLTQIGRFRIVTPVWIHWWIWNDTQSLMWYRRHALLFPGSSIKFRGHTVEKSTIWIQFE